MQVRDASSTHIEERSFSRWLGYGFWAVMDQGLFAVSNFVLTVLLARWLSPQEFGAFTVAYTAFWIFHILHGALLEEPLLVFGPGKYNNRLPEYLGALVYGSAAFAALSSTLLLLVGLGLSFTQESDLPFAILGLAFAAPFILFQWLLRRACYVQLKPRLAALSGAFYMVLLFAGIYVLHHSDLFSAPLAFGLMGLASSIVGLWLAVRLRVKFPRLRGDELVRDTLKEHWSFGRWATFASGLELLAGASGGIYYLVLPIFGGLEAAASLRALMNLITPVLHTNMALAILLVPAFVRAREHARFKRIMRLSLVLRLSLAGLFWLLLGLFHRPLITWLYGGKYMEYAELTWLVGLVPFTAAVIGLVAAALRALERPDRIFWAYVLATLVALAVGPVFLAVWTVAGAVVTILVSSSVATGAMVWFFVGLAKGHEWEAGS